jgi:hypothetical protein
MDVNTPLCGLANNVRFTFQEPFTYQHPVAEVAAQIELRKFCQNPSRRPGIIENSPPMSFVRDRDADPGFEFQRLAEEPSCFLIRKPVTATMAIYFPWPESTRFLDNPLETLKVVSDGRARGDDLGDVVEPMKIKKFPESLLVSFIRQDMLNAAVLQMLDTWEKRFPGLRDSPKMSINQQLHHSPPISFLQTQAAPTLRIHLNHSLVPEHTSPDPLTRTLPDCSLSDGALSLLLQ